MVDADEVIVKEKLSTKSMLASKNVRPNVRTPEQGYHWLSVLAGELNVRLRESREIAPGLWPKTLVLGHRQGRFRGQFRAWTLAGA
jgi:DNA polymerase eta